MVVTGRDAEAAAAGGFLSCGGSDDAGAVRRDEARVPTSHGAFYANHILDGNAFGDGDDQLQSGIDTFENSVGSKWRRHENGRNSRARRPRGIGDGIENRHTMRTVLEELDAFAGRDARDNLR